MKTEMEVKKGVVSFDNLNTKTAAEEGVEIPIRDAAGMESGLFVTIYGFDAKQMQQMQERLNRQRGKLQQKSGKSMLDVIYDTHDEELELIAEGVKSWRHVDGDMPFSADNKGKLVEFFKQYPLAYDQIRLAQNDRANFTKPSSAT
jgi:hypothetical protein